MSSARGFALILALLALTVLTLLGLSLAAVTAGDLQSATNYRWDQQAFYNAEAGLETARVVLRSLTFDEVMPSARTTPWASSSAPATPTSAPSVTATRNYERGSCDGRGHGVGFGAVLFDGTTRYENIGSVFDHELPGSFTVWARRPLVTLADGTLMDSAANDRLILTVEGLAPYTAAAPGSLRAGAAVRILEAELTRPWSWDVVLEKQKLGSAVCKP